jgi:peptidyl-prolyl cis-trans isomerase D
MLQNIGDKLKSQRWLAIVVLGGLALIFALWGAYGVVNMSFGAPDYGLKINGEPVSTDTLNRAWQERQAQAEQMLKGGDLNELQKSLMQQQLIEQYVRETVLRQRAQDAGFRATDQQVVQALQSEPAFQLQGRFDPRVAKAMLMQIGMSEQAYLDERRQALQIGQLSEGIELSDFLTPSEIERIYALENEQRELRYALLPADRFMAGVKTDDAAIKAWYDGHARDYMSPESVKLEYAQLSLAGVAAQLTVTPQDLQAYYDKNKAHYGENEKRHAHHILIGIAEPKDAKADAAALAKATQVLAELKSGKDFSELAKKYSADPGSAAQGGDLGWAEKGAYVAPFAQALFSMQPGQVSDPVKTQFGYHLIKLDEVRGSHVKTLDDAHAQIEADYRRDQASEIFGDRQEQLQQKLESGSVNDLDALARQFDLQTGVIADFTRTSGGAPLGSKPELLSAVFSDDVLSGNKLGGPVAVADDQLVVFKVLEHHPSAPQPLASVRDEIIAAIRKSGSTQAAKAAADAALARLNGGANFDEVLKGLGVSAAPAAYVARSDPQLPAQVRLAAFSAPRPGDKPEYRALALDNGGAALVAILAVKAGTAGANPQNDAQLLQEYMKRDREGAMNAYVLELQRRATVKRNPTIFQ